MAAELFYVPQPVAFTTNGLPAGGAKAYFYEEGTLTPAPVYTTSALTTAHAHPVVANAAGRLPDIYLDDTVDYRLIIKDREGNTLGDEDPYTTGAAIGGMREKLTADRTYYVRTNGSDSNDGLSNTAGGAFLTIQKAIDTAYSIDLRGFKALISVADGTYSGSLKCFGRLLGAKDASLQPFRIIGNEATPASVIIQGVGDQAVYLTDGAYLLLAGMTITNAGGGGMGLVVQDGAVLEHRNLVLGAINSEKILTTNHATVRAIGPTTVSGNSTTFCHATKRSVIDFSSQTLTFSGAPVFSTYLWGINDASINLDSSVIVGTATGGITVHDNGILNVSSISGTYTGGAAALVDDGGIIAIADRMSTRNFYVRTDGADTNDGYANTAARAFHTIQAAVNAVAKMAYNPVAFSLEPANSIVINVGAGTYAETVNLYDLHFVGGTILGDVATPSNVVINGVTHGFAASNVTTKWFVRGMRITATAGSCIYSDLGSYVQFQNVEFGAASFAHIYGFASGKVFAGGNYSIIGAAAYHIRSNESALVDISGRTITLTGTPAFATAFVSSEVLSSIRGDGITFSGAATGTRYVAITNSVIFVNGAGATYFPGSGAGSTATGGQYA